MKEHTDPIILKFREKFDKYRYESVPKDIDVPVREIEQFILQALAEQKKEIIDIIKKEYQIRGDNPTKEDEYVCHVLEEVIKRI